ncbi:MAG: response regulator [Nanoarchaeota archaeon]
MDSQKPLEILVVDDEAIVRRIFAIALKNFGANVDTAVDGQDGLTNYTARLTAGVPFDLVLTDLNMPSMNGAELTRRIKELNTSTQVVVITGYEATEEYKKIQETLGASKPEGVVQKPIGSDGLRHLVNQAMIVRDIRKSLRDYQPDPFSYIMPEPAA